MAAETSALMEFQPMRKSFAVILLGLALAGGIVTLAAIEKPTPVMACQGNDC